MAKKHLSKQNDHISKIAEDYGFFDWKTIWDDSANGSLKQKRGDPNVLFKGDKTRKGRKGDEVKIPAKNIKEDSKATDNDYVYQVPRKKLQLNLRVLNVDFTPIKQAQYELSIEGRDESYSGKTNDQGEIIAEDIPLAAQRGKLSVRVSPQDANVAGPQAEGNQGDANAGQPAEGAIEGDVPVTWELKIGGINPIMEQAPDKWCISGVQQRLNNLGINSGPVDGKLGVCTRSAVEAFQSMFDLDKDGKPGQNQTQPKLRNLHDKNTLFGPPPKAAAGITPVPKDKRLKTTTGDIGHVAPSFDGTFFNTLVIRPEYRISLRLGEIENLFAEKPDTDLGRMARFQVLGLYYFPLGHRVSTTPGEYGRGWHKTLAHVKTKIFGFPAGADAAKVDEGIKLWLKTRVVHGGVLPKPADDPRKPQEDNFRKIRLPGGFTFLNLGTANTDGLQDNVNQPPYDFRFDAARLYNMETKYYDDNAVLGKIPLVAKVERKIGGNWKAAKEVTVYFKLMKPYELPKFDFNKSILDQVNSPPLRQSTIGDRQGRKQFKKGHGPYKAIHEEEQFNYDPEGDDPQVNNCHMDHGGKRGDSLDKVFDVQNVPGFNSDHSDTRKVPHKHFPQAELANDPQHPHAVKVKTNEDGEAGVIFMPSRCGGDRYRIRAYVGPPTLPSDGTGPDGVRVETGTFIVWRNIRVSRCIRQNVGNTILQKIRDQAGAANNTTYLKWLSVADKKGNIVGLPDYDFSDRADKKAGSLGGPFDGLIAQFARAFCELERDSENVEELTDAEWQAAVQQAIDDANANKGNLAPVPGYNWNQLDVPRLFLDIAAEGLTVDNSGTHLPLRHPHDYYSVAVNKPPTAPVVDQSGNPVLDSSGNAVLDVHPGWINGISSLILFFMLPGFSRHLSKNGFLPGLTLIQGGFGCTWQLISKAGLSETYELAYGGIALFFRACFDWGGKAMYLKKVSRPAKKQKNSLPYCYDYSSTVAHEMGHLLFRVHAPGYDYNASDEADGVRLDRHDPQQDCICGMSYKTCEGQFCAECLLALRGWKISAL
jgi:hypothetical protein